MFKYTIPEAGNGLVKEIKDKCYWELVVTDRKVLLIQRGGPLEPVAVEVSIDDTDPIFGPMLEVTDFWEWGAS